MRHCCVIISSLNATIKYDLSKNDSEESLLIALWFVASHTIAVKKKELNWLFWRFSQSLYGYEITCTVWKVKWKQFQHGRCIRPVYIVTIKLISVSNTAQEKKNEHLPNKFKCIPIFQILCSKHSPNHLTNIKKCLDDNQRNKKQTNF